MNRCFIIALLILPLVVPAQSKGVEIPQIVKIQFMEDYISASNVNWDKNNNNQYTASFLHHSHFKKATYPI